MIRIKIKCHQPVKGEDSIPILEDIEAFIFNRLPGPTTVTIQPKKPTEEPVLGTNLSDSDYLTFDFTYKMGTYRVKAFTGKADHDSQIHLILGTLKLITSQQAPEEVWAGDDGPLPFPWDIEPAPDKGNEKDLPIEDLEGPEDPG